MNEDKILEPMQRLTSLIVKHGPYNIKKLANLLGLPVETVRYRVKRLMLAKGFRIHGSLNYNKLGLVKCWAFFDFAKDYEGRELPILRSLADMSFLTYYCRTLPNSQILVQFTVPKTLIKLHNEFLDELRNEGIIKNYELFEMDWMEHIPFKARFYNFKKAVWDIDWDLVSKLKVKIKEPKPYKLVSYDKKDLLILKELQIDAFRNFKSIADKLAIDKKTLLYHYHSHIKKRGLIDKYIIRWTGDLKSIQRYRILYLKAWINDCSESEMNEAKKVFNLLPFTWSDSYSKNGRFYIVDLALPLVQYPDTLRYLQSNLGYLSKEINLAIIDPSFVDTYVLPHHMFIEGIGWKFEKETIIKIFKPLVRTLIT